MDPDAFAMAPLLADRYAPLGQIGEGGMGRVFLAWDLRLERQVALKLVKREDHGGEAIERLLREARSMAQLSHANVLPVYDVAEHEGRVFMVMEYVPGRTLRAWLAERQRTWREIVDMFLGASRGLAAAHEAGLVHRDFKPDNVLIGRDGRLRVMDFGLVRPFRVLELSTGIDIHGVSIGGSNALTVDGYVLGTPAYMSPEQHAGEKADARADQYSFCVSLWEALFGERPFEATSIAVLASAKTSRAPRPPESGRRVPRSLIAALYRGLAVDPDARFANMLALQRELTREPNRWWRRLAVVGVAAATMLGAWLHQHIEERRRAASCAAEVAAFDAVWNDDTRIEMRAGLLASRATYAADTFSRTAARLDTYGEAWKEVRAGTCAAQTSESEIEAKSAQMRALCLDAALDELEAFVDVLSRGDTETVRHAVTGAAGLPAPSSCTDDWALPDDAEAQSDPSLRAATRGMWRELARARALLRAHSLPAARSAALEVGARADLLGLADMSIESRLLVGEIDEALDRFEAAREGYEGAFVAAIEHGDERRMSEAARHLVYVEGARLANVESGMRWAAIARAGSARLDLLDRPATIELWLAMAAVYQLNGRLDAMRDATAHAEAIAETWLDPHDPTAIRVLDARVSYERETGNRSRALTLAQEIYARTVALVGEEHPDAAAALGHVGALLADAERIDEARDALERALAQQQRFFGPRSAAVATTTGNLGRVYELRGEPGRALDLHQQALEIKVELYGEHHPKAAETRVNIGNIHLMAGEFAEAIALNEQARADLQAAFGPLHPSLGHVQHNLGVAHEGTKDYVGALPYYQAAASVWTQTLGPDHPMRARAVAAVGNTMFNLERRAEAIAPYREALRIWALEPGDGRPRATVQWMLAVALAQTGGDREEARALALQARAYFSTHAGNAGRVDEIDEWMPKLKLG